MKLVSQILAVLLAAVSTGPLLSAQTNTAENQLADLLRDLGNVKRARRAAAELSKLRERPTTELLNEIRTAPESLFAAAEHARKNLPSKPAASRPWLENYIAGTFADFGMYEAALSQLQRYVDKTNADQMAPSALSYFAKCLILTADLQRNLGRSNLALKTAERAVASCEKLGPNEDATRAQSHGIRGRILFGLNLLTPAAKDLREAKKLAKSSGNRKVFRKMLNLRAELYLMQRESQKALKCIEEISEEDRNSSAALLLTEGLARLGLGHSDHKEYAPAKKTLLRCLKSPGLTHSIRVRANSGLIRAALSTADLTGAQRGISKLRQILDQFPGKTWLRERIELEAFTAQRLRKLVENATPEEREAKTQALREHSETLTKALESLRHTWKNTPLRLGGLGFLVPRFRRELISEIIDAQRIVHGDQAAARINFEMLMALQTLGSSAREFGAKPISLEQLRRDFLLPGQATLVYLAAYEKSHLFAVDAKSVRHFQLPSRPSLTPLTKPLRTLLSRMRAIPLRQQAAYGRDLMERSQQLGELLIPKALRPELRRWTTVTVADHGILRGIPFESLSVDGKRLVGETVGVNTLASLPVGIHLLPRLQSVARDAVALDLFATLAPDSIHVKTGPNDPRTLTIAQIQKLVSERAKGRSHTGKQVTAQLVRTWPFGATITHILAHGVLIPGIERSGALALTPSAGDNGLLNCLHVDRLKVSGLIILSACGSGRAVSHTGDEGYHPTLGGSMLRAGAHTVVQSRGDLRLQEHIDLIQETYVHLLSGQSTSASLSRARRALIPRTNLSGRFHHAQVQSFGLGNRPVVRGGRAR